LNADEEFRAKERERHRLYRLTHKPQERAYRKKRYAEHKEEEKQYRLANPEIYRKGRAKWKEENPYKVRELANAYAKRNHLKQNARLKAKRNVPLEKECELCPEDDRQTINLEHHHPDYDYPLIIVTVCQKCHEWIEADKRGIKL
jgi:hypothetical protein